MLGQYCAWGRAAKLRPALNSSDSLNQLHTFYKRLTIKQRNKASILPLISIEIVYETGDIMSKRNYLP